MAAADMVFPPRSSPSAPPPDMQPFSLKLEFVEVLVILAAAAMFLLHVLGSLRRQSSNSLVHSIVMGVYVVSYPLVGYTIGRMQSTDWYVNDFVVWAVFLLLLLSNTDSLTACRLSDIDNWKSICVKNLFKGFLLVYVLVSFGRDMDSKMGDSKEYRWLWYPLSAIVFVAILKSYVMIASMRMVSKSYLGKNAKVIAEYMKHKDKKKPPVPFDPVTMEGYQYMVSGERHCIKRPGRTPCYDKVTTVEQIWKCTGNLLTNDRDHVLKDVCLSMALSKILNRRFARFNLSEAELDQKTKDLVFKGLLVSDKLHQRVFRVIEQELVFVHDIYYTRYSYLYQKGRYLALCLPVVMFALCCWLSLACLGVNKDDRHVSDSDDYRGMQSYTIFMTVVLAFLEAYQVYLYIASGWFKVALIRSHVTASPFLQRSCCCFEKMIHLLLWLKAFPPWKRTLGQYCLLDMLGRKSKFKSGLHYATLRLVNKSMKGRKKSVKLSKEVKAAIVDSLLGSNGHLTNGVTTLRNNGVHGHLSWACDGTGTDGAVTRTILVWHIATTLCEHHHQDKQDTVKTASTSSKYCMHLLAFMPYYQRGKEAEDTTTEAVKTASTLSKYCMHLVAFLPDLLPDHSSISESILDESVEEAGKLLQGAKDLKSRCEMLMKINTHDSLGDETRLVAQGVHLYRHLIEDIQESALRWKVLSDFWAEMMLYISPSDDARAHLELLARGGEFITHLWALLTHAGVLKRGQPWPNNVV